MFKFACYICSCYTCFLFSLFQSLHCYCYSFEALWGLQWGSGICREWGQGELLPHYTFWGHGGATSSGIAAELWLLPSPHRCHLPPLLTYGKTLLSHDGKKATLWRHKPLCKKQASQCIQTFTMFLLAQYKVQPTLDKYKRTQKKASMDKDLVYHIPMKSYESHTNAKPYIS